MKHSASSQSAIARDHQVPPDRSFWSGRAVMFSMFADPSMCFSMRNTGCSGLGEANPATSVISLPRALDRCKTTCGIELIATHGYSDLEDGLDTLVVVGGAEAEQASMDPSLVECVRSMAPKARRVASICTGAFILAAAGLLHQRRVTTHWKRLQGPSQGLIPRLKSMRASFSRATGISIPQVGSPRGSISLLFSGRRGCRSGNCPGRCPDRCAFPRSPRRAVPIQRLYELARGEEPARNTGTASLDSLSPRGGFSVEALADRMGMSPRNFARLFRSETGEDAGAVCRTGAGRRGPHQARTKCFASRDHRRATGLRQYERMRRTFQRHFEVSPHDYRARFRTTSVS